MEEITLKKMKLPADKPNYYVPMNEGAFFDLCKAQEKNLSAVSTSGLCGCVAIPIYIKDGNKSYLFLNHIDSALPLSKVNDELEKIKTTIGSYLPDFDYNDDIFEISIFVVGNQFGSLGKSRTTMTLGPKIVENITERLKNTSRKCYVVDARTVAFVIENNKVKLIEPELKKRVEKLTYFGERHAGYGKPTTPNDDPDDNPYKYTCIDRNLEF